MRPVVLVILDGWGIAPPGPGNAVELARTPVFDALWERFPHGTLAASGEAVGLPPGQMGNSEVGHLTIGSGRILFQDLARVNAAVADGSFAENDALVSAFGRARERGGDVHLLGLVSYGGVHSHIDHLRALLALAEREGMAERTWIHAFTDGRDVSPLAAASDLAELPVERIATVCGRYYAMDRDSRWERTDRAFRAICLGEGDDRRRSRSLRFGRATTVGVTDEFIEPIVSAGPSQAASAGHGHLLQLPPRSDAPALAAPPRGRDRPDDDDALPGGLPVPVAFDEQEVSNTLAEVLAAHGLRQLHVAETEKYAHVTYFFNGGEEREWEGETRILVPSPRDVPSYDLKPEMSAAEVADRFCGAIGDGYAFAVVNFANPDMVGHTGSIPAVVAAVEAADRALGQVVECVGRLGGVCFVTADHGNAEVMLEPDGVSPHTAHTTNRVPLIVTNAGVELRSEGELSDLAPTILGMLDVPIPVDMTGTALATPS